MNQSFLQWMNCNISELFYCQCFCHSFLACDLNMLLCSPNIIWIRGRIACLLCQLPCLFIHVIAGTLSLWNTPATIQFILDMFMLINVFPSCKFPWSLKIKHKYRPFCRLFTMCAVFVWYIALNVWKCITCLKGQTSAKPLLFENWVLEGKCICDQYINIFLHIHPGHRFSSLL